MGVEEPVDFDVSTSFTACNDKSSGTDGFPCLPYPDPLVVVGPHRGYRLQLHVVSFLSEYPTASVETCLADQCSR